MPDTGDLQRDDRTGETTPPTIDVRLSQLRAEHDRIRELIAVSVIDVRADAVRIIMTPAIARELFSLLDVGVSLGDK